MNLAGGLTVIGTPRKRKPYDGRSGRKLEMQRQRGLRAWYIRTMKLRNLNLTTRGTQRIYAVHRADALVLKSQIDMLAAQLASVFHSLPQPTQATVLELENTIAAIRKQVI